MEYMLLDRVLMLVWRGVWMKHLHVYSAGMFLFFAVDRAVVVYRTINADMRET